MSFAEKYKKKEAFTSQALKTEAAEPKEGSATSEIKSNNTLAKKPIDLQKRMLASLIYLVKGVDAGRNAWYYVLVERNKVQLFLKALNDDIIHLENYGKILYSAYGDEPPAEITNKLKEEYGID
jgi:hypothetical protein